jgi:mono/diheme cytochrome c family protein
MRKWELWFCITSVIFTVLLIKWIADASPAVSLADQRYNPQGRYLPPLALGSMGGGGFGNSGSADDNPTESGNGRDSFLRGLAEDASIVLNGKMQYEAFCLACHGGKTPVAAGSPSYLFDGTWHHGSRPQDIEKIIRDGYLDMGMPPWGGMVPDEDIEAMTAYLLSNQP